MTAVGTLAGAEADREPQQDQQPPRAVFRATTRLVIQTVTVKDKSGKPVEGLTAADFLVTEEGQPQAIAFVDFQRLGTEGEESQRPPRVPPVPANVDGPAQARISVPSPGDIKYRDRRLLILYFDLSSMPVSDQMRAFTGARKYVETQMAPSDLVAIMVFNGGAVRVRQDFTGDRNALREVIEALIGGVDQNSDGIPDEAEEGSAFGENGAEFNIFKTDRQLSALQSAVTMLRPLPEQKALVYFGSGFRLSGADNRAQLRATINAAVRANVSINPVDARGLVALAPIGDATRASQGGVGMFSGSLAEAAMVRLQRSQDTLYALAKDTGGKATVDHNDLSLGVVQAAETVTSYYIVAYYSTHTAADGRFRSVRVALKAGMSAELSYRDGYFADKAFARFAAADRERQLEEALKLEDPITQIHVVTELNYFRLNRAEYFVPVSVRIPGSELTLARRRGVPRTLIDVIGEVKDDHGVTHRNVRDKLDVRLTGEIAARLSSTPIQYETGFTLLPGRYVIKVLARDATTGRIGTYEAPFEIPNLDREDRRLPISSVVLSGQRVRLSDALYQVRQKGADETANPLVSDGHKLIPSVTRVFRADRNLHVFLQAYPRAATIARTTNLVAFVTLYRGDLKAFETPPLVVTGQPIAGSQAMAVRFSIPLGSVPPGPYESQVTVLDSEDGKVAFWRASIVLVR